MERHASARCRSRGGATAFNIMVVVLAVLLVVTVSRSVSAQEWVKAGSKLYYVSAERMTWKEAATFCVLPEFNNRFRFAEVKTKAQNKKLGKALLAAINTDETGAWFSASRVKKKKWKWGNLQDVTFTAWAKGQPGSTDRCAFAWVKSPTGAPKWGAAPCNELRHAVCEAYSFSRMFTVLKRNKRMDKYAVEKLCKKNGGRLSIIDSPGKAKVITDTIAAEDDPAIASPTKAPIGKPSKLRPCCRLGDEVGTCCPKAVKLPLAPPSIKEYCAPCRCCCCKGNLSQKLACCRRFSRPWGEQCGCDSLPSNGRRLLQLMMSKPRSRIQQFMDDSVNEEARPSAGRRDLQEDKRDNGVFLGASNEKLPHVKEENASFVWDNGVSFKPIGYFPKSLSQIYTNWATFPLPDPTKACVALNATDGKWYNEACTTQLRGAVCELAITKKNFQVINETRTWHSSGYLCSLFRQQHASIKTDAEFKAALQAMQKEDVAAAWTSARQFGDDRSLLYWADGMLLARRGATIGLKTEVVDRNIEEVDCVALYSNGTLARLPCSEKLVSLCEYRPQNAKTAELKLSTKDGCFPGCLKSMRGDGELDDVCNHYTCNFDNDDGGECAPGCSFKKLSNGKCDPECFTASCAFDRRDCFSTKPSPGIKVRRQLQEDDVYPEPKVGELPAACHQTSQHCNPSWIGDKYCDIIACGRECDAQDCQQVEIVETCGPSCSRSDLYNNRCDKGCATAGCNFDAGLCPVSCDAACGMKITLNQCTKPDCDVPMCRYDIGMCRPDFRNITLRCSPSCDTRLLGNGQCNSGCNNPECKWDAGDCPQREYCPYPVPFDEYGCIDQCNKPMFKFQRGMCPNECLRNGCTMSKIGNGVCDRECNNPKCGMDAGDCAPCAAECNPFQLNNGVCDETCNTDACGYDGSDCLGCLDMQRQDLTCAKLMDYSAPCAAECNPFQLNNGVCDETCNTDACGYDGSDCLG